MRKPELLIPASSLEVLKTGLEQMLYILEEKRSAFVQRQETFPEKIWRRELLLPMQMG